MDFEKKLAVDRGEAWRLVGTPHSAKADAQVGAALRVHLEQAAAVVEQEAQPRMVYGTFALGEDMCLGGSLPLQGEDIRRHVQGCTQVVALAVTLGARLDQTIRAAQVTDMVCALLLDGCASALADQYADAAQASLRATFLAQGRHLTGRFSPGYGDLPLEMQKPLVRLLQAGPRMGLSVGSGGLLAPLKSITALLGVADHPVGGHVAGCESCALQSDCRLQKEGLRCGRV